jgi:hypothetical protein
MSMDLKKFSHTIARRSRLGIDGITDAGDYDHVKSVPVESGMFDPVKYVKIVEWWVGLVHRNLIPFFGRHADDALKFLNDRMRRPFIRQPGKVEDIEMLVGRTQYELVNDSFRRAVDHKDTGSGPEHAREFVRSFVTSVKSAVRLGAEDFLPLVELLRRSGHGGFADFLQEFRDEEREDRRPTHFDRMSLPDFARRVEAGINASVDLPVDQGVIETIAKRVSRGSIDRDSAIQAAVLVGYANAVRTVAPRDVSIRLLSDAHLSLLIRGVVDLFAFVVDRLKDGSLEEAPTADDVARIASGGSVPSCMKSLEMLRTYAEEET